MPLLLDSDYAALDEQAVVFLEDETQRFLILCGYPLPEGTYNVDRCEVLVVIPQNYNQAGNDMFWTHPRLTRLDGKPIPSVSPPGGGENRIHDGNEFCRWSRHWTGPRVAWRAGVDDVTTIVHRIRWALNHPDAR